MWFVSRVRKSTESYRLVGGSTYRKNIDHNTLSLLLRRLGVKKSFLKLESPLGVTCTVESILLPADVIQELIWSFGKGNQAEQYVIV